MHKMAMAVAGKLNLPATTADAWQVLQHKPHEMRVMLPQKSELFLRTAFPEAVSLEAALAVLRYALGTPLQAMRAEWPEIQAHAVASGTSKRVAATPAEELVLKYAFVLQHGLNGLPAEKAQLLRTLLDDRTNMVRNVRLQGSRELRALATAVGGGTGASLLLFYHPVAMAQVSSVGTFPCSLCITHAVAISFRAYDAFPAHINSPSKTQG